MTNTRIYFEGSQVHGFPLKAGFKVAFLVKPVEDPVRRGTFEPALNGY